MAIITEFSKKAIGTPMDHATDASGAFARVEPLLTPEQLRDRHLPGIPLAAAVPDPVTKKRFVFSDALLKDYIEGAISKVELALGLRITPMEVTRRLPFDRNEFKSLGYFQLPDAPVQSVEQMAVSSSDGNWLCGLDPRWVEAAGLQRGRINLIPMTPAYISAGMPYGQGGQGPGGNYLLSVLGDLTWVPALFTIRYIVGFGEGRIPRVVNEVIGTTAAIDVLNRLAATNRVASYSIGLDGASQSVSTQGVAVYDSVIKDLQEERKGLISKLQAKFGKRIFSDSV